jgi:periplasmic protein TonB
MSRYLSGLALVVAASLHPMTSHAQKSPSDASTSISQSGEQTYLDFQVERAAKPKAGAMPVYPDHLRAKRVEGTVLVQFVVDQRGRPEMASFKVLRSTHAALTQSVRSAVAGMSFFPAESGGQKVKQLVQLPFTFDPKR